MTTPELRDLEDRLQKAYEAVRDLMVKATNSWERTRLQGKMEGIALALSYLRETDRQPAQGWATDAEIEQAISDYIDLLRRSPGPATIEWVGHHATISNDHGDELVIVPVSELRSLLGLLAVATNGKTRITADIPSILSAVGKYR